MVQKFSDGLVSNRLVGVTNQKVNMPEDMAVLHPFDPDVDRRLMTL